MSLALTAYRWLTGLLEPLAPRLLDARAQRGKEDRDRLNERLGHSDMPRPDGPLVWLHGVSVGETLSLLPVVDRLRRKRPDVAVLVTSGTLTSAAMMAKRLPPGVIHQFAPIDGPKATAAFLDHWRPDVGVLVESELWPNLILGARERGVKLVLASARITDKTAEGWQRFPGAARDLLAAFADIMPQDEASTERLRAIGARTGEHVNLKLSGGPLPDDTGDFARLSAVIGDRPVVLAASTHPLEELAIVRALDQIADRLFLIVAPRHPERSGEVSDELTAAGYVHAVRSRGDALARDTDIYLGDTLGEMGLFMRLADVVVMGGSFSPVLGGPVIGGHNPLEPARLGKPAVSGPDVANWTEVCRDLAEAGGLAFVSGPGQLSAAVAPLLADPAAARAMGERARKAAARADVGLDRLWARLEGLLPPPPRRLAR